MKEEVLVIHPNDRSTDFLIPIYESIPNKKVIRNGFSFDDVYDMIRVHERIIILGHGSPFGLFSMGQFLTYDNYIVNHKMIKVLMDKPDNVYIWCNADMFMNSYPQLKGFYSGMFISEVEEADYMGIFGTDQDIIDESNNGFSQILGAHITKPVQDIYTLVKKEYEKIALLNPVAAYNHHRLYVR